jgi:hypothetical protein
MSSISLNCDSWNVNELRYMKPKVNDMGGKSISVISTQTNRSLHVATPVLMTWGISDYVNERGESDGKYTMNLNFPLDDNQTGETNRFLDKIIEFENKIIDDAVKNSEDWFGEERSREIAKHSFFPFVKYPKDKDTKKIDKSRPPSIKVKVPKYGDKWSVEIYNDDDDAKLLFPNDEGTTPLDFVPKRSDVMCLIQCGGVWVGGKGWGVTWKLSQAVVKPPVNTSVFGKCHLQLSSTDRATMNKPVASVEDDDEPSAVTQVAVVDTDDENEDDVIESPEPPKKATPPPAPKKKIVRKKTIA